MRSESRRIPISLIREIEKVRKEVFRRTGNVISFTKAARIYVRGHKTRDESLLDRLAFGKY